MQKMDGNFVIYPAGGQSASTALWSTHTYGHSGASLTIQNDGNLVVTSSQQTLWTSNSASLVSHIGAGFNAFSGLQMPSALNPNSSCISRGRTNKSYIKICTSIDSFNDTTNRALGFTAQATTKSGSSNSDSDSSSSSDNSDSSSSSSSGNTYGSTTTASHALNITDTSVSVVVYSNVVTSSLVLDNCQLQSNIAIPVTAAEGLTFFNQYGDSFVAAITEGCQYIAVFVFYCQTTADQKAIQEALTVNGNINLNIAKPAIGVSITAGLQNTLTQINVSTKVYQSLRGSTLTVPASTGDALTFATAIINFAENFQSQATSNPRIFDFEIQGYETLLSGAASTAFANIAANREIYLQSVLPTLTTLQGILRKYQWIQDAYDSYGYTGDTGGSTFSENFLQLNTDINNLTEWTTTSTLNPTQTPTLSSSLNPPQSLLNGVPVFNYQAPTQPLFGNNWGGVRCFRTLM